MAATKEKNIEPKKEKELKPKQNSDEQKEDRADLAKARKKTPISLGVFHITANFNNTIIAFTDDRGNVLAWSSAGAVGFKNTKESTPYAGAKAADILLEKIKRFEISEAKVLVRGIGPGRDSALRTLFTADINFQVIEDKTPIPFGGSTPSKPRRV